MRCRLWARVLTALSVLGLMACGLWLGLHAYDQWLHHENLAQAKEKIAAGSTAQALLLLSDASGRWPKDGEILYLLGTCELALNRPDRAEDAWIAVPLGSPFYATAALMRVRRALEYDRLAEAEELLPAARNALGDQGVEALEYLIYLDKLQGRVDEVTQLLRDGWDTLADPIGILQQLWQLDKGTFLAVEEQRRVLEQAARNAPEDDRVWLGLPTWRYGSATTRRPDVGSTTV